MMYLNMEYAKDSKAQYLCEKHISNMMAEILKVERDFFEGSDCDTFEEYLVDRIFPPNTTANKNIVKFFEQTIELLESDEIFESNILQEYIIFSAIHNYYCDADREYTLEILEDEKLEALNIQRIPNREEILEKVKEHAIEIAKELYDGDKSMEEEIQDALYSTMQLIEDLTCYIENIEDTDFMFLDEYSYDELLKRNKALNLGIRL